MTCRTTKEADHADLALFAELLAKRNDDGARTLTGAPFSLVKKIQCALGCRLELRCVRSWGGE
ncbi:MAG: hypothetical protein DWI31_02620 [Candidatus Aquidulcis sp.]|nr:MAG: hypothetical protein DWI31_02620 [Candidatus Aquidulcis sp.]